MPPDSPRTVTLTCHPETPTDAVRGIAARVSRTRDARLAVSYILDGDLDRVRLPAPRGSGPLWQHTCCEIFIGSKAMPAYYEYNLSPSGEWAAYAFDGYRRPRAGEWRSAAPALAVRGAAGKLELEAVISLDRLPALPPGSPLSLALSAVIEDRDGALSYWALRHPAGRPDFHHAEAFALDLERVDG